MILGGTQKGGLQGEKFAVQTHHPLPTGHPRAGVRAKVGTVLADRRGPVRDRTGGEGRQGTEEIRPYCPAPLWPPSWSEPGAGTHCPVTGVSKGRSQDRQWKCAKSCL